MLDRYDITSPEMNDLLALERLDPPQGVRSDYHMAVVASAVMNSRMGASRSVSPAELLPEWGTKKPMSIEQQLDIFRSLG